MSPQADFDDELDYQVYFRPHEGPLRNLPSPGANFGLASAQRFANESRYSRQRVKGGQSFNGAHRRGGKKFFSS